MKAGGVAEGRLRSWSKQRLSFRLRCLFGLPRLGTWLLRWVGMSKTQERL